MMSTGWQYKGGTLHCDGLSLEELRQRLRREFRHQGSPSYVYSSLTLRENVNRYKDALQMLGNQGVLSYSVKANNNPHLLSFLRDAGVTMATTVSGNEVLMALKCGFSPENIILNGNGKRRWEVEMAVNRGILLNIDSAFDAHQLVSISRQLGTRAKALLRLNPAIDAQTHPYLTTAFADSKFGVGMDQVDQVLKIVGAARKMENADSHLSSDTLIDLQGVHIHTGSGISDVQVYVEMMKVAVKTLEHIQRSVCPGASTINLGGGLSINQETPQAILQEDTDEGSPGECEKSFASTVPSSPSSTTPTPEQLVNAIKPYLPKAITLILEPGRSLVATSGVVMTDILGVKRSANKEHIVVDAAMTEVIRPALYGATHPVSYVTPPQQQDFAKFDVVGPVCESGDFIMRGCRLRRPILSLATSISGGNSPTFQTPTRQPITTTTTPSSIDASLQTLSLSPSSSSVDSCSGSALVVWTAGAYCSSMASNYNLRPFVVEVLVLGPSEFKVIRRPQTFENLLQNY